jgi:hypothetical protein
VLIFSHIIICPLLYLRFVLHLFAHLARTKSLSGSSNHLVVHIRSVHNFLGALPRCCTAAFCPISSSTSTLPIHPLPSIRSHPRSCSPNLSMLCSALVPFLPTPTPASSPANSGRPPARFARQQPHSPRPSRACTRPAHTHPHPHAQPSHLRTPDLSSSHIASFAPAHTLDPRFSNALLYLKLRPPRITSWYRLASLVPPHIL